MGGIPAANDKIITPKKHKEIIKKKVLKTESGN